MGFKLLLKTHGAKNLNNSCNETIVFLGGLHSTEVAFTPTCALHQAAPVRITAFPDIYKKEFDVAELINPSALLK